MSADASFVVEYAKTAKSSCKGKKTCGDPKIEKGALRIGRQMASDRFTEGGTATEWYHPACVFEMLKRTRPTTRKIMSPTDIDGFGSITPDDQALIRSLIDAAVPEYKTAAGGGSKSKAKPKPQPKLQAILPILPVRAAPATAPPAKQQQQGAKGASVAVVLEGENGNTVRMSGKGPHVFGSGSASGVNSAKCSSKQVELTVVDSFDSPTVKIVARGVNPSCLYSKGNPPIVMKRGVEYEAVDGDQFTLLADKYHFTLHFETGAAGAGVDVPPPPPAKRAALSPQQSDDDEDYVGGNEGSDKEEDTREWCKYGKDCYQRAPEHLARFRHPPK